MYEKEKIKPVVVGEQTYDASSGMFKYSLDWQTKQVVIDFDRTLAGAAPSGTVAIFVGDGNTGGLPWAIVGASEMFARPIAISAQGTTLTCVPSAGASGLIHVTAMREVVGVGRYRPSSGGGGGAAGWTFAETFFIDSLHHAAGVSALQGGAFASDLPTSGITYTIGTGTNPDVMSVALPPLPAGFDAWLVTLDEQSDYTQTVANVVFNVNPPGSVLFESIQILFLPQAAHTLGQQGMLTRFLADPGPLAGVMTWTHEIDPAGSINNAASTQVWGSVRIDAYKFQNGQSF